MFPHGLMDEGNVGSAWICTCLRMISKLVMASWLSSWLACILFGCCSQSSVSLNVKDYLLFSHHFQSEHMHCSCMWSCSNIDGRCLHCQNDHQWHYWRLYHFHCQRMTANQIHWGIHLHSWWIAEFVMTCRQCLPQFWRWLMMKHGQSGCKLLASGMVMQIFVWKHGKKWSVGMSNENVKRPKWLTFFQNVSDFCHLTPNLTFGITKNGQFWQKMWDVSCAKSKIVLAWSHFMGHKKCQMSDVMLQSHSLSFLYIPTCKKSRQEINHNATT